MNKENSKSSMLGSCCDQASISLVQFYFVIDGFDSMDYRVYPLLMAVKAVIACCDFLCVVMYNRRSSALLAHHISKLKNGKGNVTSHFKIVFP